MSKLDYIVWNESFATGIPAIDKQHRSLIRLINDIFLLLSKHVDVVAFRRLVSRLQDYTRTHFAYEEKFMKDIGYPGLPGHLAEHRKLVTKTQVLHASLPFQTDSATQEMFQVLRRWWVNHICNIDMAYARFHRTAKESDPSSETPLTAP